MDIDFNALSVVKVNDTAEADILLQLMKRAMMLYAQEAGIPLYRKDGSYTLAALNETRGDLIEAMRADDFLAVRQGREWLASVRMINDFDAQKSLLTRFCVEPNYKSQGIGSMLLNVACDYVKKKGIKEVYLYTAQENERLLKFYRRHGFILYSVNRGRPYPRVCLMKDLYA